MGIKMASPWRKKKSQRKPAVGAANKYVLRLTNAIAVAPSNRSHSVITLIPMGKAEAGENIRGKTSLITHKAP